MTTTIPVGMLAPAPNQWDLCMLMQLLDGTLYPHGLDTRRYPNYPNTDGCVLVVPGRYWAGHEAEINEAAAAYSWLLLMHTSDEEQLFDSAAIEHPNMRRWVQTPRVDRDYGSARLFGVGYTPHFVDLPADPPERTTDIFLAAQNTHERRHQVFKALDQIPGRDIVTHQSHAFTEGLDRPEYVRQMMAAKIAPCPAGPASPDTFRFYEALQAHCVPIADDITPGYNSAGYWRTIFKDPPFPILVDYGSLRGYAGEAISDWPLNTNRITAWWMRQKRQYAIWLREDLEALGAL